MKIADNNESVFTDEQLKNLNPKHLLELLTLQKKHSESLESKVKLYEEKLQHLEFINALLNERLTLSQRKRFGSSSEKYEGGYEQSNLFNEAEENADTKAQEPLYEEVHPSSYKRKKQKGKKENDLSKFPVVRIEHKLTEE